MYNVFFEDADLILLTKIDTFIEEDSRGFYIDLVIRRPDVIKLMLIDVVPKHRGNGVFILRVRLNNNTQVSLNGIRVTYLGDERFKSIPLNKISLREMVLKRYSLKTQKSGHRDYCYATKALFKVKVSR